MLLNWFMAGETTLEEEALLREWFRQHPDVSDDLKEYQMMFGYFDEGMPLEHEAEKCEENVVHPKTSRTSMSKARMRRLWLPISMAASIALLIAFAVPRIGKQIGQQAGHQDDSKIAQLDGSTAQDDTDSAVVQKEKTPDADLSMPEKIKKSGDSVSPKTRKHKQKKYRQHLFAPAPPKLWIAQNIATDSLLAEPENLPMSISVRWRHSRTKCSSNSISLMFFRPSRSKPILPVPCSKARRMCMMRTM